MESEHLRVEGGVRLGHEHGLVVLVHLGQVDAVLVQFLRDLVPPNGEVLLHCSAEVATVGRRLRQQLVEGPVWALPIRSLHCQESCEGHERCDSEIPASEVALYNRSHKEVGKAVTHNHVHHSLT